MILHGAGYRSTSGTAELLTDFDIRCEMFDRKCPGSRTVLFYYERYGDEGPMMSRSKNHIYEAALAEAFFATECAFPSIAKGGSCLNNRSFIGFLISTAVPSTVPTTPMAMYTTHLPRHGMYQDLFPNT